jgi:hypothetical protein
MRSSTTAPEAPGYSGRRRAGKDAPASGTERGDNGSGKPDDDGGFVVI